jgi:threonine/homoserine/homoserine lactone efflux protein
MAWIALLGASRGAFTALIAVAGITLGLSIAAAAAAFGVSVLISSTPWVFETLRIAGSLYLLYLAWDSLQFAEDAKTQKFTSPLKKYFFQGLLSNMLNPKAYMVYAAVLPQFIDSAKPLLSQLFSLSVIYVIVATIIHVCIATLSGRFTQFFKHPTRSKMLGKVFAVLLTLVAIWFFHATKMK